MDPSHSVLVARYGEELAVRIIQLLDEGEKDLLAQITSQWDKIRHGNFVSGNKIQHLNRLLAGLRIKSNELYQAIFDELKGELEELAILSASIQAELLKVPPPSNALLKSLVTTIPLSGQLLEPWVKHLSASQIHRIEGQIRIGVLEQQGIEDITRRIAGTRAAGYRDGIMSGSRSSIKAMVRTAVTGIHNQSQMETWKANSHIVAKWRFLATLDSRTSTICGSLDGQTFPIGEGPMPPRHPNCRSISVPVLRNADNKRASEDGPVKRQTYSEWLNGLSVERQDIILGPTRGEIFRKQGLSLSDLLLPDGSLKTIDQLKTSLNRLAK